MTRIKTTKRTTIDELARMINRNFATKADLDTAETNIANLIKELPTRSEIKDLLDLDKRVERVEKYLGLTPIEL